MISSRRADCRMQGVEQYLVFLQIDRSQPARRYCCFDASQIGRSLFPACWILALGHSDLQLLTTRLVSERGPHNDARVSDGLLDAAGQQLQEFAVWVSGRRSTVQTRGRSRLGEPGRLPECLCWSGRWLVYLALLFSRGPCHQEQWLLASGLWHSWMPWPQPQLEIIPLRDASYSCLASEIPATWREMVWDQSPRATCHGVGRRQ